MTKADSIRFYSPLRSLLSSVICQGLGLSSAVLIWQLYPLPALAGCLYTVVAVSVALFLRLPTIWLIFNGILPITLWFLQPEGSYPWLPPLVLLCLLALFLPTLLSGVPYYPSSKQAYQVVLRHLPENQPFRFIDLGCGFAGMLVYLARNRPLGQFVGIEISPVAFLLSKCRKLISASDNVTIEFKSIWAEDLNDFDIVYAFLSPLVMKKIWKKAELEMEPEKLFISNSFETPGKVEKVYQLEDDKKCTVLIYRMPKVTPAP